MKRILLAGAVVALAACSSGSPSSAPSSPPPASPSASVDAATAGTVCAALNALVRTGTSGADAIATAGSAYHVSKAQVVTAIDERCPALKRIVPTG